MRWTVVCIFIAMGIARQGNAAPELTVAADFKQQSMGIYLDFVLDHQKTATVTQILSPDWQSRFQTSQVDNLHYSYIDAALWVRFKIKNEAEQTLLIEILSATTEVDFFFQTAAGLWEKRALGILKPFYTRKFNHPNDIISLPQGKTATYYMRFASADVLAAALRLWKQTEFFRSDHSERMALGIYYGVMLIMIFYNFFIFLSLRDKIYGYYIFYIVSFLALQARLNGLMLQYVWPNMPIWNVNSVPILGHIAIIAGLLFTQSYLRSKETMPNLHRFMMALSVWAVIDIGLALFVSHRLGHRLISVIAVFTAITIITAAVRRVMAGDRSARFFLAAWVIFACGIVIIALSNFDVIPRTFLSVYGIQIGSALEVTLLSLGLADQINSMRQQIKEQNRTLEDRVTRRTNQLSEKNTQLEGTLTLLTTMQSQLVESEKMASLGQLVAGIAHEINTPLGVGLTAATHIAERAQEVVGLFEQQTMKRSDLASFFDEALQSTGLIVKNLVRTDALVKSFKMVAADQTSQEKRSFNIIPYLQDIIYSLQPKLKKTSHHVEITGPEDVVMVSFPGALAQVITNFVNNSIIHGFEDQEGGVMTIDVRTDEAEQFVIILYQDNGKGVPKGYIAKIFDPFVTTKRGQGGTGLGLNIVFNLVTGTLGGTINCESNEGQGLVFTLTLPLDVDKKALDLDIAA